MLPVSSWLDGPRRRIRILMYHGVGVPNYPRLAFERQVERFARAYDIVSLDRALEALATGRTPGRPLLVLTFDDGLRNNHRVAYPLLKRLGLPAVFYVCPGLIEQGAWLWNHDARARLGAMSDDRRAAFARQVAAPTHQVEALVDWMKDLRAERLREVRSELLAASSGWQPTAAQRERYDMMSWDELLSLDPAVVTVGSHTVNHPILTGLDANALDNEVRDSRRWLEERLKRRVEHFCYPNGANNTGVRDVVAKAYSSAVNTFYGYAAAGDDRHNLRRIAADPRRANMAWRMHKRYPVAA